MFFVPSFIEGKISEEICMMLEKEFVRLWLPITCFTIHSTDRQKCSIFNHILWLCAKIRGKWEETPWNREQWDVKMSLDLDTGAASLLLPLLWTMKIKTFGAMVVEKPHFWLTNYQILIVSQFPHICKHTIGSRRIVWEWVFPFSNFPHPPWLWRGQCLLSYFEMAWVFILLSPSNMNGGTCT